MESVLGIGTGKGGGKWSREFRSHNSRFPMGEENSRLHRSNSQALQLLECQQGRESGIPRFCSPYEMIFKNYLGDDHSQGKLLSFALPMK